MFPLTAALGALLLFAVQPIVASALLPWFGGAAAVWTVCLVFFQAALVAGYAYAHWIERRYGGGAVPRHLLVLALAALTLPIIPDPRWQPQDDHAPSLLVLGALLSTIGAVYVALAATAPLVQSRLAASGDPRPFRLYAWSNAGSFLALLAYPFLIEPWFGARGRAIGWSVGYGVFVVVCAAALWRTRGAPALAVDATTPPPTWPTRLRWAGLSGVGVVLLMGTSEAIAQDLSVVPLFWVLPLMAYLASYVLAFARDLRPRVWAAPFVLALGLIVWLLHRGPMVDWWLQLAGWCGALFVLCAVAHGALARTRPDPAHLTRFYLDVAIGGATGGLLAGIVAPLVLPGRFELHLGLLALWALIAGGWWRAPADGFRSADGRRIAILAGALLLAGGLAGHVWKRTRGGADLHRNFYGVLQVKRYSPKDETRALMHLLDGRISHGFQFVDPKLRRQPTAYFEPQTGIGHVMSRPGAARRIGIVGLGVGTLAAYGRPGDHFTFYELNPAVVAAARTRFTYLADSAAEVDVVVGDGRLALAARPPQGFTVLALDAFTGDAIPTHLLTREAMSLWLSHLAPDGILAVNVSNRHTNLRRVVRAHAEARGLSLAWVHAYAKAPLGRFQSDWMLLSRTPLALEDTRELAEAPLMWTDDHAPILPLLR